MFASVEEARRPHAPVKIRGAFGASPEVKEARKVKILEGVAEYRLLWTLDMKENAWARLLAYVTGLINQELLLKNEYLAAENRILRAHMPARLRVRSRNSTNAVSARWNVD